MAAIVLSETAIANRALQYVGGNALTNLWTDTSRNAVEIQNCYHMVRRAELRRNVWRFAIRQAALRAIDTTTNNQRQVTFGAWASGTTYAVNDVVLGSDGRIYFSKTSSNVGNDPADRQFTSWGLYFGPVGASEYVTDWSASLTYSIGQHAVGSDDTVYVSLQDSNLNQNPISTPAYWEEADDDVSEADSTVSYMGGEMVFTGNKTYLSLTNDNTDLPTVTTSWQLFSTSPTLSRYRFIYPIGSGAASQTTSKNVFQVPNGFLRLASGDPKQGAWRYLGAPTNSEYSDWNLEGAFLTTVEAGPIVPRFCADIDDPALFDPLFSEGLACRIALSITAPLTQSLSKREDILKLYQGFMTEARLVNGIETGSAEAPLDDYLACRI